MKSQVKENGFTLGHEKDTAYIDWLTNGGYLWIPEKNGNRTAFVSTRIARTGGSYLDMDAPDNYRTIKSEDLAKHGVDSVMPFGAATNKKGQLQSANPNCGTGYTLIPVTFHVTDRTVDQLAGWIAAKTGKGASRYAVNEENIQLIVEFLTFTHDARLVFDKDMDAVKSLS